MKKFFQSLQLKWSDLFLLIGFIPFAIFLVFGQQLMQTQVPEDVGLPVAAIVICFVICFVSWWIYLHLERKEGNFKVNWVFIVLICLALLNVIVICAQPSTLKLTVINRTGANVFYPATSENTAETVFVNLSGTHKLFFSFDIIAIIEFIYICAFVFPKRFASLSFVKILGYVIFAGVLFLSVYSFITEANLYKGFFQALFSGNTSELINYAVKSCIIHRNAYGMFLLMGIIFALINHSFNKKWYNYLIIAYCYINMIFTLCKTSLLISALITIIYVYFRLIIDYKNNSKRNLTLIITYSSLIGIAVLAVGASLVSKGKVLGFIYNLTQSEGPSSLTLRSYIWDNTYSLLGNGNWLAGRGFGIINTILYPMNKVNGDAVFPTHNSFLNMLAEGGILYLLMFLMLVAYSTYIIFKSYKKNPNLVFALALGAFAFLFYSFIETIHYLYYLFLLPIFIFYELEVKSVEE